MHYSDLIADAMVSQITSFAIVCSTVCLGAHKKHQSSASLAFVREIHRRPVNSPPPPPPPPPAKGHLREKCFHFMTSSWEDGWEFTYCVAETIVLTGILSNVSSLILYFLETLLNACPDINFTWVCFSRPCDFVEPSNMSTWLILLQIWVRWAMFFKHFQIFERYWYFAFIFADICCLRYNEIINNSWCLTRSMPSHYLNQQWHSSLANICMARCRLIRLVEISILHLTFVAPVKTVILIAC